MGVISSNDVSIISHNKYQVDFGCQKFLGNLLWLHRICFQDLPIEVNANFTIFNKLLFFDFIYYLCLQKKNQMFFHFLNVGEVRGVANFCLELVEKVGTSLGPSVSGPKTHNILLYNCDTTADASRKKIGPLVWLLCQFSESLFKMENQE